MRRRLLTILFTLLAPFAAHAEWLIAECSAYTPYDCGTITATGEAVHVGGGSLQLPTIRYSRRY